MGNAVVKIFLWCRIQFAARLDALAFVDIMAKYFPQTLADTFATQLVQSLTALLQYCLENSIGKTTYSAKQRTKRGRAQQGKGATRIPALHRVTSCFLCLLRLLQDTDKSVSDVPDGTVTSHVLVSTTKIERSKEHGSHTAQEAGLPLEETAQTLTKLWQHGVARLGAGAQKEGGEEALLLHLGEVAELGWLCLVLSRFKQENVRTLSRLLEQYPLKESRTSDRSSQSRVALNGQLSLIALVNVSTTNAAIVWLTAAVDASSGIYPWTIQALKQGFSLNQDDIDHSLVQCVTRKCAALLEGNHLGDLVKLLSVLNNARHEHEAATLLPHLPMVLWRLFDGTEYSDDDANREAEVVLSFVLRLLRREPPPEMFAKRFVSMFYATRKGTSEGVMGPFASKMNVANQILTLRIAAFMGPLSSTLLQALAINIWLAPKQTPRHVIVAMADLPFVAECEPAQQLSFAMTLLWGKTREDVGSLVTNKTSNGVAVVPDVDRHTLIAERMSQQVANIGAGEVDVLASLGPLLRQELAKSLLSGQKASLVAGPSHVVALAAEQEILQRRLTSLDRLCACLRELYSDDDVVNALGANTVSMLVATYAMPKPSNSQDNQTRPGISPTHESVLGLLVKLANSNDSDDQAAFPRILSGWCAAIDTDPSSHLEGKKKGSHITTLLERVQLKSESEGGEFAALAGRLEALFA